MSTGMWLIPACGMARFSLPVTYMLLLADLWTVFIFFSGLQLSSQNPTMQVLLGDDHAFRADIHIVNNSFMREAVALMILRIFWE